MTPIIILVSIVLILKVATGLSIWTMIGITFVSGGILRLLSE